MSKAVGAGFAIALFWNYINLFVTTFFKARLQQLSILLRTGQLPGPDLLIAMIAVAGHFLLIIGGGALAIGYFVAIMITTGAQYIGLLKQVFRL